jgi:hypothetical protein
MNASEITKWPTARTWKCLRKSALACLLLLATHMATAQEAALWPTYTGQSIALQVDLTGGTPLTLVDSGPAPAAGGMRQNVLWDPTPYGVNGRGFYAMSDGVQGIDHSTSMITLVNLPILEHRLVAQYVKVDASARSVFLGVSTAGTTVVGQLVFDGQPIAISGAPNQKIGFSDGYLIINEQGASTDSSISGAITVNGIHVVVYGMANVIVCSSRAGVTRPMS